MSFNAYSSSPGAMNHAMELLHELHQTLDFIRAETGREDLATAVKNIKGPMAALREELEESLAHCAGLELAFFAEDFERNQSLSRSEDGPVFSISEYRNLEGEESHSLDRTYRALHRAWNGSMFPEEFNTELKRIGGVCAFGWAVAEVLIKNFDDAKAHMA